MQVKDRLLGSFLGLAIGDAVGTTVEFRARDTFEPVTDMVGKGPFNLPAGYFTDDTSMALCLAESLIEHPQLDRNDLLNRFSKWYREGVNSPTGRCFDIGATTSSAIVNWETTGSVLNNTGSWDAGNGSIMRLEVKSSGYVIHTLHAALWCFKNTDNFRDAILLATNLGHDADTVAAVTGQIAGAFYGMSGIPIMWLDKLYDTARFIELVDKLTNE